MKNLLFTTATVALFAGVASAEDFDNTTFETVLYSDRYQFTLSGDNADGFNSAAAGVVLFPYELGTLDANVYVELGYHFLDETVTVTGEYQMSKVYGFGELYGAVAVDYTAADDDLGGGDWNLSPYIGAAYDMSDNVVAFAEVGYSWNMSQEWDTNGGYGEIGVDFLVDENIKITPSVVKTFDTPDDSAQVNLTVAFAF